jgi:hypothetical protein
MSTRFVRACSKPAIAAALAALSSSSLLSGSTTSMTPLMPSRPSTLGATASILPASWPATFTRRQHVLVDTHLRNRIGALDVEIGVDVPREEQFARTLLGRLYSRVLMVIMEGYG